ncbi:carboxymuconolactone decarboxylase family protein [Amycolatopsis sp. SID8362]|uniref:carboxymuconolactone decarboxylase family protein n=1 Tax=Amycolatopsis sp. SID8362 TaxID=2690346 RepID=UPI0013691C6E|nr:carboxymuconolactone decarboxylase family protein [Amycolatopsis sp. SID8362]NBH12123.1 carboxymuconolactone decarboxylase family protein [Amycolatopsis sp. SID8362]NED48815.1 carboxymuconolactone decarboxylase family protein [Amycolatopsis sp. SID8362]
MGSRLPNPVELVPELRELTGALFKVTGNGSVPRTTIALVQLRAGQIVGNTYLTVLHTGTLRRGGEPEERITAVATWPDAPYFTEPERAALGLVEAVLQPSTHGERVSDELYAQTARHYDDKALTTLALAIGQVTFYAPLAVIGKPLPGKSPAEQWVPASP